LKKISAIELIPMFIATVVLAAFCECFLIKTYNEWFIMPVFKNFGEIINDMSYAHIYALLSFKTAIFGEANVFNIKDNDNKTTGEIFSHIIGRYIVLFGLGYILSYFI